jgi:hypothetical protein
MAIVVNQAPVAFSAMTSGGGSAAQLWQVSTTGTSAGVAAGNFYLDSSPSNLLNGRRFLVSVGGWVKAHGATQTFAPGLQIFPWNTTVAGGRTASGTATFTPVASGQLTSGTFYDFYVKQEFFGEANANTLTCFAPTVYVAGSPVTIVTTASPVTVAFASASQTEPITGINQTTDYPLASFVPTFANTTPDTVETMQLTSFSLEVTV